MRDLSASAMVAVMKILPLVLFLGGCLLLAGCVTMKPPPPPQSAEPALAEPYLVLQYGRVVRANAAERYVILECAVLPNEGQRFTLYREQQPVAVVRISNIKSGKHAAANVEEGAPRVGDWFMQDRQRPEANGILP